MDTVTVRTSDPSTQSSEVSSDYSPEPPLMELIRERNRELGVVTVLVGLFLLLTLRWWTSPLTRRATGVSDPGLVEFLLIPVFFVIVAAGIALFLWEPEPA